MSRKRAVLQKVIDSTPDETLDELFPKIMQVFASLIPFDDEEISAEEWADMEEGLEQIKSGEYVTLDELKKSLENEDN